MIELEIESRKVVQVDVIALQTQYPREWAEALHYADGDVEEAEREFIVESYLASQGTEDAFRSTPYDDTDYRLTRSGEGA